VLSLRLRRWLQRHNHAQLFLVLPVLELGHQQQVLEFSSNGGSAVQGAQLFAFVANCQDAASSEVLADVESETNAASTSRVVAPQYWILPTSAEAQQSTGLIVVPSELRERWSNLSWHRVKCQQLEGIVDLREPCDLQSPQTDIASRMLSGREVISANETFR